MLCFKAFFYQGPDRLNFENPCIGRVEWSGTRFPLYWIYVGLSDELD